MKSKILITGGSGFIGSYLAKELSEENEVILFDNGFRAGFDNIKNINISLIKGDVTDFADWKNLPSDIDIVYHLAAINGTKFFYEIPNQVLNVNIQGIFNLMKWLSNSSVNRFFFSSSSEVYGIPKVFPTSETEPMVIPDPLNPRFSYSSSKMIGEIVAINNAKSLGIDYTIGRFHNVYGPKMGFEHVIPEFIRKCVKNEEFTVQGNGDESRCFCFIDDAINAIKLVTENPKGRNQIFNIGTNEEVTINNLITKLETVHKNPIKPVYVEFKNSGTNRRVPDISKISQIGFKPKVSFDEGLKVTYDWYSNYYLND